MAAIAKGQPIHTVQLRLDELATSSTGFGQGQLRRVLFDAFIEHPCSSRKKMIDTIGSRGKTLMDLAKSERPYSERAFLTGQLMLDVYNAYYMSKDRCLTKDPQGRALWVPNEKEPLASKKATRKDWVWATLKKDLLRPTTPLPARGPAITAVPIGVEPPKPSDHGHDEAPRREHTTALASSDDPAPLLDPLRLDGPVSGPHRAVPLSQLPPVVGPSLGNEQQTMEKVGATRLPRKAPVRPASRNPFGNAVQIFKSTHEGATSAAPVSSPASQPKPLPRTPTSRVSKPLPPTPIAGFEAAPANADIAGFETHAP